METACVRVRLLDSPSIWQHILLFHPLPIRKINRARLVRDSEKFVFFHLKISPECSSNDEARRRCPSYKLGQEEWINPTDSSFPDTGIWPNRMSHLLSDSVVFCCSAHFLSRVVCINHSKCHSVLLIWPILLFSFNKFHFLLFLLFV